MAQGTIKLKIDPKDFEKVKTELLLLYSIADRAACRIEDTVRKVKHEKRNINWITRLGNRIVEFGEWVSGNPY